MVKALFRKIDKPIEDENLKDLLKPSKLIKHKVFNELPEPLPITELPKIEHENSYSNLKYGQLSVEQIMYENRSILDLDIMQLKLQAYVQNNYIADTELRNVLSKLIVTINNIKIMMKSSDDISKSVDAITHMRQFIEMSYRYHKSLNDSTKLSSEKMGLKHKRGKRKDLWGDRYRRYHVGNHVNLGDISHTVNQMLNDISYCLDKICKHDKMLKVYLNM